MGNGDQRARGIGHSSLLFANGLMVSAVLLCLVYLSSGSFSFAFVVALGVAGPIVLLKLYNRPVYILYLLLFLVPLHGFMVKLGFSGVLSYWKEILLIVGAFFVLLRSFAHLKFGRLDLLIICFVVYTGARAVLADDIVTGLSGLLFYTLYTLVYFMTSTMIRSEKRINTALQVVVVASVALAIGGICQSVFNHELFMTGVVEAKRFGYTRASFSVGSSIVFGGYLATASSIPLARLLVGKSRTWSRLIVLATLYGAIVLSFTRVAWAQVLVILVVQLTVFLRLRVFKTKVILLLNALLGFVAIGFVLSGETYFEFFEAGILDRLDTWLLAIRRVGVHPLFGQDPGTTIWAINAKSSTNVFVTESYLVQIGLELGLVGLFLYLAIIWCSVATTFRSIKKTPTGCYQHMMYKIAIVSALLGLLFNMLFAQSMNAWVVNMMFWFLVGLVRTISRLDAR